MILARWGGGTVFHFVDAAPQQAIQLARDVAGDLDVRIGGGPSTVRQLLAAGLIAILHVVQVPILLGRGVRLWDGLEAVEERYDVEDGHDARRVSAMPRRLQGSSGARPCPLPRPDR